MRGERIWHQEPGKAGGPDGSCGYANDERHLPEARGRARPEGRHGHEQPAGDQGVRQHGVPEAVILPQPQQDRGGNHQKAEGEHAIEHELAPLCDRVGAVAITAVFHAASVAWGR